MSEPIPHEPPASNILVSLVFFLFRIIISLIQSVSYILYSLLSRRLSVTLKLSSLLLSFVLVGLILWAFIRYWYLTTYSRLPPDVPRQQPKLDLFMDTTETNDSKSGFSSYLEDFFSAIKIFGFLERSVFHELTRQMQTYKLEEGEVMRLNEHNGFSVVVDGVIQLYVPSTSDIEVNKKPQEQEVYINGERYQLINEVKRGAPISSLFTVLSLFTGSLSNKRSSSDSQLSFDLNSTSPPRSKTPKTNKLDIHLDEVLIKAKEETTIAIIPQRTFHKLVLKYPKAAVHIIQVVLTRLSRVTFRTAHNYLDLTPEIFKSELSLNKKGRSEIPKYLKDRAVSGIQDCLKVLPDISSNEFVYLAKPQKSARHNLPKSTKGIKSRQVVLNPSESHPGDLLTNVPLSRASEKTIKFSADEETTDSALRAAVTECIFTILGFDKGSISNNESILSVSASPLITAIDDNKRRSRTSFSNIINNFSIAGEKGPYIEYDVSRSNSNYFDHAQIEATQSLEIIYYRQGSVLVEQNDESHGIFYVIDGELEVGYRDKTDNFINLYTVSPGYVSGFVASVLGSKSFVEIRSKSDVHVGFLPQSSIEILQEKYPQIILSMAKTLTESLSDIIVLLDFALEWVQVPGSHVLFNQGDAADAIYIVLNGRLRSVLRDPLNNIKIHGEYGQGESVGELEVLTISKRPYTLHAIRETELARFPRYLFEILARRHPSTTIEISRLVASRVLNRLGAPSLEGYEMPSSTFRTVAIIPISKGMPVADFGKKLFSAFKDIGQDVFHLNIATVLHKLGRNAFSKIGDLKLSGYLADLEERYQTVLYVADSPVASPWTRTCIAQADCILLLTDASSEVDIGEYERLLVTMRTTAKTELILLHQDRYVPPGLTAKWLKNRIWVNTHHHIQMEISRTMDTDQTKSKFSLIRSKVKWIQTGIITKYKARRMPVYSNTYPHKNDFARLARILSGNAIGLVLGGGGARGVSHIGVIKALEENGVPIDYVGGTSIGSFVGGLYAKDYDTVPLYGRTKQFAMRISSLWRMIFDLTYPATSYTTGHEFNRGLWKAFGDYQIEDFWLRYFVNTTNITHSRMDVHQSGYAWRYIRASMSLAGLLPPINDQGSMLLDGGYVDNLPVEQMKTWGAKYIFAVDVGSVDDTTPMSYGDSLSGLWVLFNRWNIFSRHPNVPNLAEIQQRLAYVSSVGALEKAKTTPGVYYLRPTNIENYATLDFGKFDEIYRLGTLYGHRYMDGLKKNNQFPKIAGFEAAKGKPRKAFNRRNSI